MLYFILLSVLVHGAFSYTHIPPNKGCIYQEGICVEECPEGTHAYTSSCTENALSERTCNSPEAQEEPPICDLSRCDCDPPKVKDQMSGKCVEVEDCPKGPY